MVVQYTYDDPVSYQVVSGVIPAHYPAVMLIVLPPSETKATGGTQPPLDVASLSFPSLHPVRTEMLNDLVTLCSQDSSKALEVLGISERLADEVAFNAEVKTSATMPAIHRYTGVLYDALDAPSLPEEALPFLAVGSALFGLVMAGDLIPHYRLSGGTKLPRLHGSGLPTMKARWGTAITEALRAADDLIVDLRSGTYAQLGRVKGAVTVRVESVQDDGSRKVVSHFNKHYKGELARFLALACAADPHQATNLSGDNPAHAVAELARAAGMVVEGDDDPSARQLTLVV